LRIEYPGAWYHVMNRGRRSEKVFLNRKDYRLFLDLLIDSSDLWAVNISAFSLMPNHYHLLINTPLGNLSRFMRHLNGIYTQRFNQNHRTEGQLFKGRYKAILVDGDDYLLQLVRYIHLNPLRAKMVKDIDDFEWSSHSGYISEAKEWEWLHKYFILRIFSETRSEAVKQYRDFISKGDKPGLLKTMDSKKWPAMMGDDPFMYSIKAKYYGQKRDKEIPDSSQLSPGPDRIKEAVCEYYRVDLRDLNRKKGHTFNEPRNVAMYLSRILRNDTLEELMRSFSLRNHSSVSSALAQTKTLMNKNRKLRRRVEDIENRLVKRQTKI